VLGYLKRSARTKAVGEDLQAWKWQDIKGEVSMQIRLENEKLLLSEEVEYAAYNLESQTAPRLSWSRCLAQPCPPLNLTAFTASSPRNPFCLHTLTGTCFAASSICRILMTTHWIPR
jgi:hypothetical protein